MAGSDWPLSFRKKPSKLPCSFDHRYDAMRPQLSANVLLAVSSTESYLCSGVSKDAAGTPAQLKPGRLGPMLASRYSTLSAPGQPRSNATTGAGCQSSTMEASERWM